MSGESGKGQKFGQFREAKMHQIYFWLRHRTKLYWRRLQLFSGLPRQLVKGISPPHYPPHSTPIYGVSFSVPTVPCLNLPLGLQH